MNEPPPLRSQCKPGSRRRGVRTREQVKPQGRPPATAYTLTGAKLADAALINFLFSQPFRLVLGVLSAQGEKIVIDYTQTGNFYSRKIVPIARLFRARRHLLLLQGGVHGLRGWKRTIDSPAAVVFGTGRNACP